MFAKVFEQILDSSIAADYQLRHMFEDMLKLADITGAVDMTYDAIARRLNVPGEIVVKYIGELMEPDPESRSPAHEGRRLIPLDKNRGWGWKIVNYSHYRQLRDEEARRSYFRDKKREQRQRASTSNGVKPCPKDVQDNSDSTIETVEGLSKPVQRRQRLSSVSTHAEAEAEGEATVPPSVPQGGLNFVEAKAFLQRLFGREKRAWCCEEEQLLSKIVPISSVDTQLLTEWFGLPLDHPVFEKTKARTQLTTLLREFNAEMDKIRRFAPMFRKKIAAAKPEPPRWQEFFKWQYGGEIRLPESFWELDLDQRGEYSREFQTFVTATSTPRNP